MSSASPAVVAPLSSGAVFHGRYRIVRALKSGGMGAVYEAVDENTAAPRALKVMLPSVLGDADQRARFALEARVTGSVESDHLVRVSDSGVDEATGSPFLVMELLRGEDLGEAVAKKQALPPAEVLTYLGQASLALDKTHAAGIVHRDVKPQNLLVTRRDDGSPCVKILDFGIAKVVVQGGAKTRALGTPLYMAPEQIKGEGDIGPRADLYSLGQVAYALLVGEPYWSEEAEADASLYGLLTKVMGGAVEPPTARALRRRGVKLPPGFDPWFFKATAAAREARFERASQQTSALAEVFAAPPISREPPTIPTPSAIPSTQPSTGPGLPPTPSVPIPVIDLSHPATQAISAVPTPALPFSSPAAPAAPRAAPPTAPMPGAPTLASAVPPPRSRGLLIALVIVGALLAVGLIVVGVALLGGPGDDASGKPLATCMPGATCLALDLPDPAHVDAQAALPVAMKLARSVDARVTLSTIYVAETGKDGTADLLSDKQILYQLSSSSGTVSVTFKRKTAIVMKTQPLPYSKSTPEPQCSLRAAFKAAGAAGFASAVPVAAMYASSEVWPGGAWTLTAGKASIILDGKTCAARTYNKP